MPFGSFFKKLFKRSVAEAADKYGGETAGDLVKEGLQHVDDGPEDPLVSGLMEVFTGEQQSGLTSLFGVLSGNLGGFKDLAASKGLSPSLIDGVMGMLGGGGGASGGGASGGGFNLASLLQVAQSLTSKGDSGGGGGGGFMSLLQSLGGGGSSNNVLKVVIGLVSSFFNIRGGKDKSMQDWGKAGADANKDDDNIGNYGDHLIKDLIFPGKKDKDVIDEDTRNKKTDDDDVKGWFGKHPEIGKMQKKVFDDIFDVTKDDDDDEDSDDSAPLIPAPLGFKEDCSILDSASILFLNTNILLELRKSWRFLYSTKVNDRDYSEFVDLISYKGPTLVIIKDGDGNLFGAFTSTSWGNTDGGFSGNGDTFIFSIKPKMACYYATGKNENFLCMSDDGVGAGGNPGHYGLGLSSDMSSGTFNEEVVTFDLPPVVPSTFTIDHVEVWGLGPEVDPHSEKSKMNVRKPNLRITGSGGVDMDDLMDQIS